MSVVAAARTGTRSIDRERRSSSCSSPAGRVENHKDRVVEAEPSPPAACLPDDCPRGPRVRAYGCSVTRDRQRLQRGRSGSPPRSVQRNRTVPSPASRPVPVSRAPPSMHAPASIPGRGARGGRGRGARREYVRARPPLTSHELGTDPAAVSADRPRPRDLGNVTRARERTVPRIRPSGIGWDRQTHQVVSLRTSIGTCAQQRPAPVHVFDRTVARGGFRSRRDMSLSATNDRHRTGPN